MNQSKLSVIATLVAIQIAAPGCTKSVETERDEQDSRVIKEGRAVVLAEYKAKYAADPSNVRQGYLYARLLEEPEEQAAVAQKLIAVDPKFAWAHVLNALSLESRGKFRAAVNERKLAASLESSSTFLKKLAIEEEDRLVEVQAGTLVDFISPPESRKRSQGAEDDNLVGFEEQLAVKRTTKRGVELIGVFSNKWAAVLVKNAGTEPLKFEGYDIKESWVVACFTEDGKRYFPDQGSYPMILGEKSCRTCRNDDIEIPPGKSRWVAAAFEQGKDFTTCAFKNVPFRGHTVVLQHPSQK